MFFKIVKTRCSRRGFILTLTLFTALTLGTIVIGFSNLTAIDINLLKNYMYSKQAYYVAEAGIADVIDKIQRGKLKKKKWNQVFPAGSDNSYSVEVVQGPTFIITSTGYISSSNSSRVLEAHVKIVSPKKPYEVMIRHFKEVIQ